MIWLRGDCLAFVTSNGESIPCSAEKLTIELLGDALSVVGPEVVQSAAAAVLHYFREELGRQTVTIGEFSLTLERVLRGFGLNVTSSITTPPPEKTSGAVVEVDLRRVAFDSGKGCELFFFPRLREALREGLQAAPQVVHFRGLRGCVKQMLGARRWTARCQSLNDRIVEYLRESFQAEQAARSCALVIR